jgi:hypothetical protein
MSDRLSSSNPLGKDDHVKRLRLGITICVLGLFLGLVPVFAIDELKCCYLEWKYSYYSIHRGMTLAEVETILGPGDPDGPWVGADGWYNWYRGQIEIQIRFDGGRVSHKAVYAPGLSPNLREW